MIELRIPASDDAVADVQLVEWIVAEGAEIAEGDPLYSIESDKSVIEVPAPASGRLVILEGPGKTFPAGHLIGRIE